MNTTLPKIATLSLCLSATLACALPDGPEATFEQVWRDLDEMYGCFELRGVDWDDSYDRYRPLIDEATSEDELFEVVTAMLAETDDGHIHVTAPGRVRWSANQIYRESIGYERFDRDLVAERYLGADASVGPEGEYILGEIDGVTYVHFAWIGDQFPILAKARAQAEDRGGGMIIDLRHNGGGDFTWAFDTLADWTARERPVFRSRTRNGPARDDFTPWFEWALEGRGRDVDFPVVVLIDRFTISAGERAVMALGALDDVRFIGEPTNGSISTTVGRELVNGWYLTISTQEVVGLDGVSLEGVGVAPDELVLNDPEAMAAGVDEVLERALASLG